MSEARELAASCEFRGRVVVSGGDSPHHPVTNSRTNEAYCHVSNEWTGMPYMVHGRREHYLIPMGKKLYAMGGGRKPARFTTI